MKKFSARFFLQKISVLSLLLFVSLISSCRLSMLNPKNSIPVFHVSSDGEVKSHLISRDEYTKNLTSHLVSIERETSHVLNKKASYSHSTRFRPIQVIIGLAISLELGFSPVYALAIQPTFQMWFRNIDVWN